MATNKKAKTKVKRKTSFEKLDDVSPEIFEEVVFGDQESPSGWKCSNRPERPSPAERALWNKIVEKALLSEDYAQVVLRSDEYEDDVLKSLFQYGLTREKRGHCYGSRGLIVEMMSDERSCWIRLEPRCVAIYE